VGGPPLRLRSADTSMDVLRSLDNLRWPDPCFSWQFWRQAACRRLASRSSYGSMDLTELEPGTELGNYVIDRLLAARGARGLYLAHDQRGRPHMLTVVHAENAAQVAALRVEFEALSRLQHRSIPKVRGWMEEREYALYSSEHVRGVPLHSLAQTARLMLPGVVAVYGQVLEAVAYLHANGVTHGDLAPVNILVHREGRLSVPVIVGFGIARVTSHASLKAGEFASVLDFVSPEHAEVLLGRSPAKTYEPEPRDDVYGMGLNLYFLLTGEWPIPNTSRTHQGQLEFLKRLSHYQPKDVLEPNPYAPICLGHLALRMLERNPAARPVDAVAAYKEFVAAQTADHSDMNSLAILLDFAESQADEIERGDELDEDDEDAPNIRPTPSTRPSAQRPPARVGSPTHVVALALVFLVLVSWYLFSKAPATGTEPRASLEVELVSPRQHYPADGGIPLVVEDVLTALPVITGPVTANQLTPQDFSMPQCPRPFVTHGGACWHQWKAAEEVDPVSVRAACSNEKAWRAPMYVLSFDDCVKNRRLFFPATKDEMPKKDPRTVDPAKEAQVQEVKKVEGAAPPPGK
jgi:serine/threonine protein kinase